MNRYSYEELRNAAKSGKKADINALGEWFSTYGTEYWNGEYYDADGMEVWPVYKEVNEDEFELAGYSLDRPEV